MAVKELTFLKQEDGRPMLHEKSHKTNRRTLEETELKERVSSDERNLNIFLRTDLFINNHTMLHCNVSRMLMPCRI